MARRRWTALEEAQKYQWLPLDVALELNVQPVQLAAQFPGGGGGGGRGPPPAPGGGVGSGAPVVETASPTRGSSMEGVTDVVLVSDEEDEVEDQEDGVELQEDGVEGQVLKDVLEGERKTILRRYSWKKRKQNLQVDGETRVRRSTERERRAALPTLRKESGREGGREAEPRRDDGLCPSEEEAVDVLQSLWRSRAFVAQMREGEDTRPLETAGGGGQDTFDEQDEEGEEGLGRQEAAGGAGTRGDTAEKQESVEGRARMVDERVLSSQMPRGTRKKKRMASANERVLADFAAAGRGMGALRERIQEVAKRVGR
jgi:hypothetical protein